MGPVRECKMHSPGSAGGRRRCGRRPRSQVIINKSLRPKKRPLEIALRSLRASRPGPDSARAAKTMGARRAGGRNRDRTGPGHLRSWFAGTGDGSPGNRAETVLARRDGPKPSLRSADSCRPPRRDAGRKSPRGRIGRPRFRASPTATSGSTFSPGPDRLSALVRRSRCPR